ncbi:GntR family transcriptional regulator [Pseudonocardia sp. RS11V-5]|uniref:GntR family transcriptional regulator n=1 Tax=Pseudonocardia terrae TaxID=2905831 RepID=UPI001E2E822A|nr:GntR family transcriptional regulator [Pseudonocardia terrae]MCE3551100.1 GntR family transcriptional regulator [Pseudonocardia terrae]
MSPARAATKAAAGTPARRGGAVERATDAIRDLILTRVLLPGQQLIQDDLAERIGLSRGPMREALRALSQDGLISYSPNRGYSVTRFNLAEMTQMYTLRDLIESQVLRTLPEPTAKQLRALRTVNEKIKNPDVSVAEAMRLNRDFHFQIFNASDQQLLVRELDRWWDMSMSYMVMGIGIWAERAEMMGAAHDNQIEAWAEHDNERLVELCREHRWVSLKRLSSLV